MLKQLSLVMIAATTGAVVALLWNSSGREVEAASAGRMEVRELVLVDVQGRPVARLGSSGGRSALEFLGDGGTPALEIGIDSSRGTRFIHFFGKGGRVTAALNSLPPNGESTLYLGDARWESRVILGALQTDAPTTAGIDDWGLQFRKPGSRQALVSALVKPGGSSGQFLAGISVVRANGKLWEVE